MNLQGRIHQQTLEKLDFIQYMHVLSWENQKEKKKGKKEKAHILVLGVGNSVENTIVYNCL